MHRIIEHCPGNGARAVIFDTVSEMTAYAVAQWRRIADAAIDERGRFTVALSGGKTPVPFFDTLTASAAVPWQRPHIFWADERFVPHDHPASNYRLAREHLLKHVAIPPENVHPVPVDVENASRAAQAYHVTLQEFFHIGKGGVPRFDVIMLGVGGDGHTASLFPGETSLKEREHLAVAAEHTNAAHRRVTLVLPVINNAANILFVVTGRNKATVIQEILYNPDSPLPAAMVKSKSASVTFLLDRDAAAHLPLND